MMKLIGTVAFTFILAVPLHVEATSRRGDGA